MTQEMKDYYFLPRPVVESRWNRQLMKSDGYSPEVSFYGQHYIVGELQETHEAANKIAEDKAIEIKQAMLKAAYPLLKNYPKAKE